MIGFIFKVAIALILLGIVLLFVAFAMFSISCFIESDILDNIAKVIAGIGIIDGLLAVVIAIINFTIWILCNLF